MFDNFPIEHNTKETYGKENWNHNGRRTPRSRHREISKLDPTQKNDVESKEENGEGVGQYPRQVNIPHHFVMWAFVGMRIRTHFCHDHNMRQDTRLKYF